MKYVQWARGTFAVAAVLAICVRSAPSAGAIDDGGRDRRPGR